MSDGGSGGGIKQATEEVAQTVGEVVSDVKDSVGEAIEQGVQSVTGTQPTPAQVQQKQQQDQQNLAKVRRQIAWMNNVDAAQKTVRQSNEQKEAQRIKEQQNPAPVVAPSEISTQTQAPKEVSEEVKRTMTEIKQSKGVGG